MLCGIGLRFTLLGGDVFGRVTLYLLFEQLESAYANAEQRMFWTHSRARWFLSSEPKCNTPADLIIGTVDQDLRECCHAMLFAFVG